MKGRGGRDVYVEGMSYGGIVCLESCYRWCRGCGFLGHVRGKIDEYCYRAFGKEASGVRAKKTGGQVNVGAYLIAKGLGCRLGGDD